MRFENMLRPAHMVYDYQLTFNQNGKNIFNLVIVANDSVHAEEIGRTMVGNEISVRATRLKEEN